MANGKLHIKRVCILLLCVLPLILSSCRTAPTGTADPALPEEGGQLQPDVWQETDTTEYSETQDDPTGNTPGAPFDPEDTTHGSTESPTTQGPTEPSASETTGTEESQIPSDPPPVSSDPIENGDTTQQGTTGETAGMGNADVPANTETGWGPIH